MTIDELETEANELCLEELEQLRDFCDSLVASLYEEMDNN